MFLREKENSNFKVLGRAAFGQLFNKNKNACNCTLYQTLLTFTGNEAGLCQEL